MNWSKGWEIGDRVRLVCTAWDRVSGGTLSRTGEVMGIVDARDGIPARFFVRHDAVLGVTSERALGWNAEELEYDLGAERDRTEGEPQLTALPGEGERVPSPVGRFIETDTWFARRRGWRQGRPIRVSEDAC